MENEKEYVVYITETLQRKIVVSAKSESEAIEEISQRYYDEEIILDSDDYLEAHFEAIEKN